MLVWFFFCSEFSLLHGPAHMVRVANLMRSDLWINLIPCFGFSKVDSVASSQLPDTRLLGEISRYARSRRIARMRSCSRT